MVTVILKQLPNILTVFRILLVPPVVFFLMRREYDTALILFVIAGLSDGLDGLLARKFHWRSRFGAIADPVADKLLMVSSFIALFALGLVPFWIMLVVMLRDLVIIAGGLVYHHCIGPFNMAPSLISKLNTFVQIMVIFLMIANLSLEWMPLDIFDWLLGVMVFTTIASGMHYGVVWGLKFSRALKGG